MIELLTGHAADFPFDPYAVADAMQQIQEGLSEGWPALEQHGFDTTKRMRGAYRFAYARHMYDFVAKATIVHFEQEYTLAEWDTVRLIGDVQPTVYEHLIPTWRIGGVEIQRFAGQNVGRYDDVSDEIARWCEAHGLGDYHARNVGFIGNKWYLIDFGA